MNAELKERKKSIRRKAIMLMNIGEYREAGIILDGGEAEATTSERKPNRKFSHDVIYYGGVAEYTLETLKFPRKMQVRDVKRDVYYNSFADASRAYRRSASFSSKRPDLFETVKINWIVKYRGIEGSIDDVAYKTGLTRYTIMRYANRGDIEIIRAEVEK